MEQAAAGGRLVTERRGVGRRMVAGALKAALLFFIVGADCSNQQVVTFSEVQLVDGVAPEVSVRAVGQGAALTPGGAAQRAVFVQSPKPGGPDAVTVLWYPPAGATAIAFPARQPANPQGPPPYQFDGAAVSDVADPQAVASLAVWYAAPAPPQPTGATAVVDVFTAVTAAGNRYSASFVDVESAGSGLAAGASAGSPRANALIVPVTYSFWSAQETVTPAGSVPLDQALCQDWAGLLQGGSFFVALRFPVETPDATDARSASLPVVLPASGPAAPQVTLRSPQPSSATVFAVPLELRPDRLAFAENNLPPAAGERWVTLAPASQPPATCPADLAGEWDLLGDLSFDFGGAASSCRECVIQEYLCYEGSSPPFFFGAGAATVASQSVYRGAGTTCAGPIPLRLTGAPPAPPFTIEDAALARSSANSLVKFAHRLRGALAPDGEAAVDITATSARGIPWQLYRDSALTQPIVGPVTISGAAQFDFWAAAHLPFGFRGPESLTVTAAVAEPSGQQAWTSDHLWAGAWTAPPPTPELHVLAASVERDGQIAVAGTLPDGAYRLVVVPNGTYLPGACYAGPVLASVDVVVSGGTLPPVIVWLGASVGSYDVLALAGSCEGAASAGGGVTALAAGDTRIVAGDGLSSAAAVTVTFRVHRHILH